MLRYRREPEYWAREVERHIEAMQEQVAEPLARSMPGGTRRGLGAFQTQVGLYGALLRAWPEMWRAARELAAEGPWGMADLG